MKKLLLMAAALGVFSGVYAKKVKIQVDMTGQTVSANGVHVAGSFQGWSPSTTTLSNGGSGNIYSAIVDMDAHSVSEFKFLNGNDWNDAENVPAISQLGYAGTNKASNGNRWIHIDSTADDTTVLPAIKFSGSAPDGKYAIRFAVNMKGLTVSTDGVHVAGAMQGWNPASTRMANLITSTQMYEWIAYVDAGTYQYKFINGNSWGSVESVASGCAVGNDGNREVVVGTADVTANFCYGACSICPENMYKASFVVDMSNSDCGGGFDSVTVTGSSSRITSWGSGVKMNPMFPGSKMFVIVVDSVDSGEVQFKYRMHKDNNTIWEGGDNRKWVIAADDTTDLTCFGSRVVGPCPSKPATSKITFMVDLSNEAPDGQGRIYVIGDFTTPQWQSGAIRLSPVSGKPGFYSTTVDVCPGKIAYKFTNGDSSVVAHEENFSDSTKRGCLEPSGNDGFNRTYTRTSANDVTLAYVFNSCELADTSTVGLNKTAGLLNNVRLYPNPTSNVVNIDFNDQAKSHTVTVMDIAGKSISTFSNVADNRLTIEKSDLAKGMLFINITNNRGESKTLKLIVQ